ncbi:MAG: helix-turn-helix domain-containing protein [Oscillospiraceae bacterium]|nr:helix-turn-helix domain-containing protein [Oscillospiraceae bacterium]
MNYGAILARLRKEKGHTQAETAGYISRRIGKPCSFKVVSHWENGVSSPSVEQFLLLCELYEVRDIQGIFRNAYSEHHDLPKLNALGKNRVEEYITMLLNNPLFAESINDNQTERIYKEAPSGRYIKLYDIPVSAGVGAFLDSEHYIEIEMDETIPQEADFSVRVSGDSMEPRFADGQVIFIKEQHILNIGEIGIFSLNGDAYIKKLGRGELISLNSRYAPIKINEFDFLRIFGKVVG